MKIQRVLGSYFSNNLQKISKIFLFAIAMMYFGMSNAAAYDCNFSIAASKKPAPDGIYDCIDPIWGEPYYIVGTNQGVYGDHSLDNIKYPSESAALDAVTNLWTHGGEPCNTVDSPRPGPVEYFWTIAQTSTIYSLGQQSPPFCDKIRRISGVIVFRITPMSCPKGYSSQIAQIYSDNPQSSISPGPSVGYPCYRPRTVVIDKTQAPSSCEGNVSIGNPIFPLTGAKTQPVSTEFRIGPISINLTYNTSTKLPLASGATNPPNTFSSPLGDLWTSNLFKRLIIQGNSPQTMSVQAVRGNGSSITYLPQGTQKTSWSGASNDRLQQSSSGWLYYDYGSLSVEVYDAQGVLQSITYPSGDALTFTYSTSDTPPSVAPLPGYLIHVLDGGGRTLDLSYAMSNVPGAVGAVATGMKDFSGRRIVFSYDSSGNLSQITWPDGNRRTFRYELTDLPWAMTGITDENGIIYSTFTYDSMGRAISTEHSGGVDKYSVRYTSAPTINFSDSLDGRTNILYRTLYWRLPTGLVVTDPQSSSSAWSGVLADNLPNVATHGQVAGSGCAASSTSKTFDANGLPSRIDDFNGNRVCRNNSGGNEVERIEGLSTSTNCFAVLGNSSIPVGSRKISSKRSDSAYNVWNGLLLSRAEPNRVVDFVYNGTYDNYAGTIANCAPASAVYPDGTPITVLCRIVERATTDTDGSQAFLNSSTDTTVPYRIRSWTYDSNGRVLTAKGPRTDVDDTTTYTYYTDTVADHTDGDLRTETNAAGKTTTYNKYNNVGHLLQWSDPNGVVTTLSYDLRQRLKARTVAAGTPQARTTSYDYWPTGLLKTVTFPSTLVSTTAGTGGNASPRSFSYGYDDAHRLTSITSASGEQVVYTLDNTGNVTREEVRNSLSLTGVASVIRREFDALGRLWKQVRAINNVDRTTEFGYDAQGNPTTIMQPAIPAYGETSGPLEVRRYNALNQLTRIEDAVNGSTQPTVLVPDARDIVTRMQAPNGATTFYARDGLGQLLAESSPDAGTTEYGYDAAGNLKTRIDSRNITQSWTYDALNRPTGLTLRQDGNADASEDRTWTWDSTASGAPIPCSNGAGRLCKESDAAGSRYYAYDMFGNVTRLVRMEGGISTVQNFGYDGEDRLASLTTAGNKTLVLVRDNEGRISQLNAIVAGSSTALVKAASYRGDGQLNATQLGNNVSLTPRYDSSGVAQGETESGLNTVPPVGAAIDDAPTAPEWAMILLSSALAWQLVRPGATPNLRTSHSRLHSPVAVKLLLALLSAWLLGTPAPAFAEDTLRLDERGNVQSRTVDGKTSTYQYDALDRLKSETGKGNQSFGLDPNGNRTSDGQAFYTVQPNSNRLLTRKGVNLNYDDAGNLLNDQTTLNGAVVTRSFTYSLAGMLNTVSINGMLVATYTHDGQNLRTKKALANPPAGVPAVTLYRYDPAGHLIEEIAGSGPKSGQSLVTYAWRDDIPVALIYASGTPSNPGTQERVVYLHADHLGTPRKASDQSARVVWSWESDAFGASAPNEDPSATGVRTQINLRLPGQYFDAESGLHYNVNRYYDPQNGRYVQSDPIGLGGGINTYSYVGGNPLSFVDPSGLATIVGAPPYGPSFGKPSKEYQDWRKRFGDPMQRMLDVIQDRIKGLCQVDRATLQKKFDEWIVSADPNIDDPLRRAKTGYATTKGNRTQFNKRFFQIEPGESPSQYGVGAHEFRHTMPGNAAIVDPPGSIGEVLSGHPERVPSEIDADNFADWFVKSSNTCGCPK